VTDWIHGTDWQFNKSPPHKERHFRLLGTQSARELVPDTQHKDQ